MKRTITQGVVVLAAGAAMACVGCSDEQTGGVNGSGTGGSAGAGGTGGSGAGASSGGTGGTMSGGAGGTAGETGSAGSAGSAGATGGGGTGGTPLDPVAELEAAQTEATSRCEGLGGWDQLTWLTIDDDVYTSANEATELIHGLPGNDDITVSWGTYCVLGGKGDDTLRVAQGPLTNSSLWGGEGDDRFVYATQDQMDRNLYFGDFESGKDTFVFDTTRVKIDAAQPLRQEASFTASSTTNANSPVDAHTVIVVPGDTAEIWLANNNEGTQTNIRLGYILGYNTFVAADFEFE